MLRALSQTVELEAGASRSVRGCGGGCSGEKTREKYQTAECQGVLYIRKNGVRHPGDVRVRDKRCSVAAGF